MKPSIPKGTRDFSPAVVRKRQYIFDTLKKVFVQYGFQPIETPTMENLSTLTGKYGEEGDQLLFKVLNSGDFLKKTNPQDIADKALPKLTHQLCEKGLRYDLTIPFARYVVMHQNDIAFPFKRYQIQPVWRADRPQKGRYREFYQCDVDIVGSKSLINEVELLSIYNQGFKDLGIPVSIKINNRKVFAAMAEIAGVGDAFIPMTIAIDKLDKIGIDKVKEEMAKAGIGADAIETIVAFLDCKDLDKLAALVAGNEIGEKGVEELKYVFEKVSTNLEFDITLARGLNYYTGCIFEVKAEGVKMGSIGGGGRYDDLTGMFGLKDVSGVGVSFGADRIYDVMEELDLFPAETATDLEVLFIPMDDEAFDYCYAALQAVRANGTSAEIYPDVAKPKKMFKYANSRGVKYTVVVGGNELEQQKYQFKNMETSEQELLTLEALIERL